MKLVARLFQLFMMELIGICLIASFQKINEESTITLFIFNLLFTSLIFQLNGSLNRKLLLLCIGNLLGLFWNLVFFYFYSAGIQFFGNAFNALYVLMFPLLNLMWVVPYWSVSLGFLPAFKRARGGMH